MSCSGLRKSTCDDTPHCDWVKSKGCKSKGKTEQKKVASPKVASPKVASPKKNDVSQVATKDIKKQSKDLIKKINETTRSIFFKSGGKEQEWQIAPFRKVTTEVDYFTGKDYKMIMNDEVKNIVVIAEDNMKGEGSIVTVNKAYIKKHHITEEQGDDSKPININLFNSLFVKLNKKVITFLQHQLNNIQDEEKVFLLPTSKKVENAFKKQLNKNPPSNMSIQSMLREIVDSLQ